MVLDNGISWFQPLLSELSFHSSLNKLVGKLWTSYSLKQTCITHTWNLGTIEKNIRNDTFDKALCRILFSWEFKNQPFELYEVSLLHPHIGRLYQKCLISMNSNKYMLYVHHCEDNLILPIFFLLSKYFYPLRCIYCQILQSL